MSQKPLTILLVNEEQQARKTYRNYLLEDRQHTYTILETASGKQTLSICSEQFPDTIVLD